MLSVNSTCGGRKSITALSQSYDGHERPVWWSRHIFHWPLCIGSPNVYLNTVELSNARIRDRCVRPRIFRDAASHKEKSFTVAVFFFCSSKIKHGSSKISAAVASLLIWAALATQLSLPVATSGGKKPVWSGCTSQVLKTANLSNLIGLLDWHWLERRPSLLRPDCLR